MSNLIGKSLGRYHIIEQLGEGGMAVVYKAYDTRLETDVAVKVIRTEALAPEILENALVRFEREAKALAKLTHANIVKVQDYGQYEDKPWLVMPFMPGGTLKEKLHGAPMPYQESAALLTPIARALDYAHQQGMIHRDVKPSNILITQAGDPMLTDFGIAKIIGPEATHELTGTNITIGTPEYMAPEQITGNKIDHRIDIYSLGIVFFEMVAGRKPYQADTPLAVLIKHVNEPLPRPKIFVANLPDMVERVLLKALAKEPDDRYQTMSDFAAALERLAKGDFASTTEQLPNQPLPTTPPPAQPAVTASQAKIQPLAPTPTNQTHSQPMPLVKPTPWWKRPLIIGIGGTGVVLAGICILAIAILYLSNANKATPLPTPVPPILESPQAPPATQTETLQTPAAQVSSTPAPTNPPDATPTGQTISINESFNADNGLFKCDNCQVASGALTIGPFPMVDSWKPFVALCESCGTVKNYKLSVETWYTAGNSNRGFGVVVRQDKKFTYMVAVSSWQVYNVFEFDNTAGGGAGYRSLIGNWSKGGLGPGRAVHFLNIVMQDGSMTLTINKNFTRIFEIPSNEGQVGLWTGSWETSASFDNFHFEEIK